MWNKPTGLPEFVSFMSQIDVMILQHLPFQDTHFLFPSQWQKSLGLLQPGTMLYISVSKKMFNDSQISPFHMTQRETQKCMTRSQQRGHQLCLGDWGRSKNGREGCLLNWAKLLVDDAELEIRGRRWNWQQSHGHCRTYYLFSHSSVVLFH